MAQEYCQVLYTDEVISSSGSEHTVLTIDGTNIGGLTDDYIAALDVFVVALFVDSGYSCVAHSIAYVKRESGTLGVELGTPEIVGSGLTAIDVEVSGTNFLIRATPETVSLTIRAFVRALGAAA
jgi:hypothetical protein